MLSAAGSPSSTPMPSLFTSSLLRCLLKYCLHLLITSLYSVKRFPTSLHMSAHSAWFSAISPMLPSSRLTFAGIRRHTSHFCISGPPCLVRCRWLRGSGSSHPQEVLRQVPPPMADLLQAAARKFPQHSEFCSCLMLSRGGRLGRDLYGRQLRAHVYCNQVVVRVNVRTTVCANISYVREESSVDNNVVDLVCCSLMW